MHYVLYMWTINLDSGGMKNVWFLCVHGNTYMVTPTTTTTKILSWLLYLFVLSLNHKKTNGVPNKILLFTTFHEADIFFTQDLRFQSVLPFYDVCSL